MRIKSLTLLVPLLVLLASSLGLAGEPEENIEYGVSEYATTFQDKTLKEHHKRPSTADHAEFEALKGPFSSGPEVTKACLGCHNKAGEQFARNKHWTWEYKHPVTGQQLGKKTLINGFCTNARGNEGMCAQCHAGYGWKGERFDFTALENIDCLVCHDSTGSYYKTPNSEGHEACSIMFEDKPPIEWAQVAQSVTLPSRNNCGKCHFFGGGGDNVKHGDLSSALFNPPKSLDVHMAADGLDFDCITCHVGEGHQWAGSRYQMTVFDEKGAGKPGMPRDTASCASCHGHKPHPRDNVTSLRLNRHAETLACETCHIPEFARGGVATVTRWDWRGAGKLKNGEGYKLKEYTQGDGEHRATYKSIKGDFQYGENLQPHYAWFDGAMRFTTQETVFDPSQGPVELNSFSGGADDGNSRIYPFKRMHTFQPYDKGNNTLVYMHLWGKDENAFWGNYDLQKAITAGMAEFDKPYSGEYGFVETYSYWPINHMVAPREQALACDECHAEQGRLQGIEGVYMPGTGASRMIDRMGLLMVFATLLGVLAHALLRLVSSRRRAH